MTDHQKKILYIKKLRSNLHPEIRTLYKGQHFKNAERTADEDATVGSCWKEYWQIFTLEDFPKTCPFCGLPMTDDEVDGCHIRIYHPDTKHWTTRKYIVPGHHGCNMKLGAEFDAKISVKAVEAIEK